MHIYAYIDSWCTIMAFSYFDYGCAWWSLLLTLIVDVLSWLSHILTMDVPGEVYYLHW
jgi:hypothetical protein